MAQGYLRPPFAKCLSVLFVVMGTAYGISYCPPMMRNQTACTCEEYVDGAIVKCNGSKGPVVVESLKKLDVDLRELALENANIIEIGPKAFAGMRIKKLILDNNKIKTIQKNAFRGLDSVLQELSIASNRLTEVPTSALEGLRALNSLNLRCNRIGNLSNAAFLNTPSLIEVQLECNKICAISDGAFREVKETLQNVILDNNCLEQVPGGALEEMNALISLHMKHNQIEQLDDGHLRNLSSLSLLTLTGNKISQISPNFAQNTPNLRYIYLGDNKLERIDPSSIKQFAAAEIIDLSFNNLAEISAELFNGMENLQHLNLESNAIKGVAAGAFATTPLLLLWLPHNCLDSVSPNMFQGAPFLKQVSLAHNNIRTVQPFSFAHLANLHTLDLSHNKIQSIQPSSIMGSDFLTVRVQENPLVCTQDGFHVMNGREAINLTTEANLICKTNYGNEVEDKCPRKSENVPWKGCCKGTTQKMTITVQPATETTTKTLVEEQTQRTVPTIDGQQPISPMGTVVPSLPTTVTSDDRTVEATITSMAPTDEPITKAKQLNMERFYRLSKRPEQAQVKHHNSRRMFPHQQNATVDRNVGEAEKGERKRLPPHVAALINGEGGGTTTALPKRKQKRPKQQRGEGDAALMSGRSAETERMAKQMLTTDIRKNSLPSPAFADSLEAKMAKRPLQENGEFSRDEEAAHVEVEEKKPSQKEVVAKQ
ncbi:hypothetical protein niasHT_017066 [Heterodera trifolii]|uniref:Uncharacterized protein n=1 Tax=Heterodera trifolii TaxID=157864 RepID=A0ABD2KY29_9BILA